MHRQLIMHQCGYSLIRIIDKWQMYGSYLYKHTRVDLIQAFKARNEKVQQHR